ncbi:TPA: hypothetical protein LEQ12_002535 [Listeria monocytogenes]|uniref:hypothetical protein n=1 Tax=Listeria monocytogenes TaxID=1639 RepID=UPI000E72052B|nr:hypothetical protein [Listeria monocytogenes]EAE6190763.1 hypothetical protein [Listeria monocytogenes]EAK8992425.1 hypothetical protein [Listeria monocytogenes]EAK8995614.1 hypothetical protein [Listeria monocytogenes]EBF5351323.1 hypothetical protein [Listeria monocytogenes]EBF6148469.1 hypothetical protein [Listeria monocytogenes]
MKIIEDFKDYIITHKGPTPIFNVQQVYRFPNNYGASVVSGPYTYGIELAVILFDNEDWHIIYDTPITNDILGYLNEVSLKRALKDIYDLPIR